MSFLSLLYFYDVLYNNQHLPTSLYLRCKNMKVLLKQDIERVGLKGEVIKVNEGYARNYLFPRKLAQEIKPGEESFYEQKARQVDKRKEVIATKTSMLAEKIRSMKITLKKKMHDDDRLYGSINANEIVDELGKQGVVVSKKQIEFGKSIKKKGTFPVTIKLTSQLKPTLTVQITSE